MRDMITNGQARRIAASWHGGQSSALYSLASCGAIDADTVREIVHEIQALPTGIVRRELLSLFAYVREHGTRGPIPGWSALWSDVAPTVDQC